MLDVRSELILVTFAALAGAALFAIIVQRGRYRLSVLSLNSWVGTARPGRIAMVSSMVCTIAVICCYVIYTELLLDHAGTCLY